MDLAEIARECKQKWQQFFETVNKPEHCIYCKGKKVSWRGSRTRTASVQVEAPEYPEVIYLNDIACRLVKCGTEECGRSWTLRPPGLFPRRHYQLGVVASATSQYLFAEHASLEVVAAAHTCSARTLGRWLTWGAQIAKPADLQRHLLDVSEAPLLVKARLVGQLARKALSASRQQILAMAAAVLGLFEALGAALGYEPPGLRSVLEIVVGNRDRVTTFKSPAVPELAGIHLFWPVAPCAM
jgi:hypothetical protein